MVVVPSFLMEDQVKKTLERLEEAKIAAEKVANEKVGFIRKVCHVSITNHSKTKKGITNAV